MQEWLEILIRSIVMFFLALSITRLMGKKQISKMTPFYFVSYSVMAIIVALISTNIIANPILGLISLGVWALFPMALDYLSLKSKLMHDWIHGHETVLIKQGKIMEENLKQLSLTGQDLLKDLRSKNIFNIADVEFAVIETTGELNVLLKSDKKPITSHDLEKKVAPKAESQTIILDGNILDESLSTLGLNRNWLNTQLEALGVSLHNVFIGQVDSSGDLYVDLFDDSILVPKPTIKEMLYANLEKAQADLIKFSLETENKPIQDMYSKDAEKLKSILEKLRPYLLR